jgi:hypothetical protein
MPAVQSHTTVAPIKSVPVTPVKQIVTQVDCETPDTVSSDYSTESYSSGSSSHSINSDEHCDIGEEEVLEITGPRMSEHKRQELAGEHLPEPLLQENPGRFVLFPIQNKPVRNQEHFLAPIFIQMTFILTNFILLSIYINYPFT